MNFQAYSCSGMHNAIQNIAASERRMLEKKNAPDSLLHELTFSLRLKMTAVSHFPRIDLTGMAVMALMNARINRRWETRERRR